MECGNIITERPPEAIMKANSIEQINVNHQCNMTLCVQSVVTQSNIRIEINYVDEEVTG